jgi:hypothetical protein
MSEAATQQNPPDSTSRQRIFGFIILSVVCALAAYLSYSLASFAWADRQMPVVLRGAMLTLSLLFLLGAVWLSAIVLVRRFRTGRFFLTRAETLAQRAEIRERMGAGKPFWPQARYWLPAWIFLAILAVFGVAVLIEAFRFCRCSLTGTLLLAVLGLALLALPGWYVFKAVRRKYKTGSFLPSQEEFDQALATCARPKPVRHRILLAAMYWIAALIWTGAALSRHTHNHAAFGSPWVLPAMWWLIAAIWTLRVFLPRSAQCGFDPRLPPSIKPPAG